MIFRILPRLLTVAFLPLSSFAWILGPALSIVSSRSSRYYRKGLRPTRRALLLLPDEDGQHDDEGEKKLDLNILLLDHYDSFTYNLADLLAQLCVRPPTVLAADCADSWEELLLLQPPDPDGRRFDGIVLSPGPGNPSDPICRLSRDFVEQNQKLPILGVCLGHQILGSVYGASVALAPEPVHGQVKLVHLLNVTSATNEGNKNLLWTDIANDTPVSVTRYHSLQVTNLEATALTPTAVSDDAVVMSMQHDVYPHFGVQFHPESIGTKTTGKQLIYNFLQVCQKHRHTKMANNTLSNNTTASVVNDGFTERQKNNKRPSVRKKLLDDCEGASTKNSASSPYTIYIHKVTDLPLNGDAMQPIHVMEQLLADEDYSFWLDESRADDDAKTPAVSILGASRQRVEYWGKEKEKRGLFVWNENDDELVEEKPNCDILTHLQEQHSVPTEYATMVSFGEGNEILLQQTSEDALHLDHKLPFTFRGGHVGYLGYEVRHDTARYLEEAEFGRHHHEAFEKDQSQETRRPSSNPRVPTAAFLWADQSFVYDHQSGDWYLVGVACEKEDSSTAKSETLDWMKWASRRLQGGRRKGLSAVVVSDRPNEERRDGRDSSLLSSPIFQPNRSRDTYNDNFQDCISHIRNGESYELCLTNQIETRVRASKKRPLDLYRILRQRNPAPFSAFFNWNSHARLDGAMDAAVAICCSSPERFVSVKRQGNASSRFSSNKVQQVEAKPIKGTTARIRPSNGRTVLTRKERLQDDARANSLQNSVKDRAENLMIVDLLRNDLSRVCETGTVHVAKLMDIESFATVHQMVSTIRGTLDSSRNNAVDVLKACFPGGSMTGAPKLRSVELLDGIEERVCRGPYSGCLGYISLNGSMDMNIVIRTAVLTPSTCNCNSEWNVSIGAGGAITALSDSSDEYEEMVLKASAVMEAVKEWSAVGASSGKRGEIGSVDKFYRQRNLTGSIQRFNMTEVVMK